MNSLLSTAGLALVSVSLISCSSAVRAVRNPVRLVYLRTIDPSIVQDISRSSLSLKVYDCYRPQRAVDDFVSWAKDLTDIKMKKEFYPDVDKRSLFKDGYIAECYRPAAQRFDDKMLDMGTGYDCFDPRAHTASSLINETQRQNRALLKSTLQEAGFKNLADEWWHYTLKAEPYPDQYFDFAIR